MRTTVLSFLIATVSIAGAHAADIARPVYKAPPSAIVHAPAYSWTGFYAGVNAGWAWSSGDGTATVGGVTQSFSGDGDGFIGGGQIGYNFQSGNIVFGLETDFQGAGGSGTVTGATFTGNAKTSYFGTIRGRIGYAFDRSLIYVTGGGLYGKSTLDGVDVGTGPFSSSATYWTWTVGGGYEAMLWDRWSAKLEYLYVGTPDGAPAPNGTSALDGEGHTNILRAGLNYRF